MIIDLEGDFAYVIDSWEIYYYTRAALWHEVHERYTSRIHSYIINNVYVHEETY